ncbi:hypothetical protein BD769DRAFT_1387906 [Suillus cothurnatus]|nr:hypothetical protein BD769DRAFT_1387906 [Suillus cothurnatus]
MPMEDSPHPGASSQAGDTSRRLTASSIAVTTTSENTQQKQQISDLVEEKLQVLESESGHAMKRGKNSQGQPRVTRRIISLDHSVEDLISENDHDDDDDHSVTLILGQDRLRIGYVALNDYHLHTPKKRSRDEERVQQDLIVANTQLRVTTQAQRQLRDSQNRIDTLHAQLFDLRDRLYDVERARNIAEMHVELLQTSALGARRRKNPRSPLPKRKTMMHEYYPDGGQSIRWVTDEEFGPYDDSSAEEGSPVTKAVGGPLACGLAARRRLTLSRRQLAWRRLQAAKNADVDDESSSPTQRRVDSTPEV